MMKKGQGAMDFLRTYGWAVLIVMFIVGALAYFGAIPFKKEFNPDLHDCVEWRCPTEKFGFKLNIVSYGNDECSYTVPESFRLRGLSSGWHNELTFNGMCVSWQPKQQEKVYVVKENGMIVGNLTEVENVFRKIKLEYCRSNISDTERCKCVNSTSVESFEYGSVNYSNMIEVSYWGHECNELIDEDSRYFLQGFNRKLIAVMPVKVEQTYDCNLPCNGTKGCYFETKCFEPLNLSLLKYKGISNGFPIYCSSFGDAMRVTANFTYGRYATMRVNKQVCVEAVPK